MANGRTAAIRAYIAAHPGCQGKEIATALAVDPPLPVYRDLSNMRRSGILKTERIDNRARYWLGRPPIPHCLTPEERAERRKIAQRKAWLKRKAKAQQLRESPPALVLPSVPEPPPAASCAVESVEDFIRRNPSAYQVLPVNWPETTHYGRIPDRIHA
jgi:hypothetical protein